MPAAMAMFSKGRTKTRKAQITSLSPDIPFSLMSARIEQHEHPEHPVVSLVFSTLVPDIHAIDYLKIKIYRCPHHNAIGYRASFSNLAESTIKSKRFKRVSFPSFQASGLFTKKK
jgi:hypothetical protein